MKRTINALFILVVLVCMVGASIGPAFAAQPAAPRTGGHYNYGEAMQKAILFYEANRLGHLPANNKLPWRADAALTDGADVGLDLTGGWADAGDGVKFGLPMAYAAGQLGWAVYEYRNAFEQAGQLDDMLDEIKWATDYFIKAHPSPNEFYYMVGYGESDHGTWSAHEFLQWTTDRKSFKLDPSTPGSDVAGQTAAALAIASIIFQDTDPTYAATCLTHAQQLFTFGDTYRGAYPPNGFYPSGSYLDDLTWAAVWLYIKTGNTTYLNKATSYMSLGNLGGHWAHNWDDVSYGAALKLAQITHDPAYAQVVEQNLDWWLPGGGLNYTPGGLAWLAQWGSLRYATTQAFLAFVWSDDASVGTPSKKQAYRDFAEQQVNYALGDNPRGGSYEVGFGTNAPEHPHHRTAQGSWVSMPTVPAFHRHILFGALVGGPGVSDDWADDVTDYTKNEVSTDYNAGFVGALARMYQAYGGAPLANWPQPADFHPPQDAAITEYFTRGWISFEDAYGLNVLFQVDNRSAWPPTRKTDMSTRYFMDLSELFQAGYSASDVSISLQQSEGATLSPLMQWSGNIYYFVVDFTGTPIYPAEWKLAEKNAVVHIVHPTAWSSANDWSYQGLTPNPDYDVTLFTGQTPYIPVYSAGVLLWGQEPGGSTNTPTRTPTSSGPTNTPTRTNTPGAPTNTPTRTNTAPAPTNTPTQGSGGGTCSPVDAIISAPFSHDGSGTFCWQSNNLGGYVNSWNLASLTINGMNATNVYVGSGSYPAQIGGYWYVSYNSSVSWGHFEAAGTGGPTNTPAPSTNTPSVPTNTPTRTNTPSVPTNTPTRTNTVAAPTNTPTRTNTPVGPTNTPVPPTVTPTRTNTPVGPTNTPVPPTATPTRTNTPVGPTNTPVPPTATPTQGSSGTCSPVDATITAPFTKDGAGTFCWQSSNLGSYTNNWNMTSLTINGVNFTNVYVGSGSYPAQIGGSWYVVYNGPYAWSHFEAK